jgi:hypothetical protein
VEKLKREDKVIIVFRSTHDAIKAKNVLGKEGIPFEVIPTPKEISAECGISLKIEKSLKIQVLQILKSWKVRFRDDLL